MNDLINPNHYKTQSGVSCIDIAELFPYSLGNAIKYAWRAGKKGGTANDLNGRKDSPTITARFGGGSMSIHIDDWLVE